MHLLRDFISFFKRASSHSQCAMFSACFAVFPVSTSSRAIQTLRRHCSDSCISHEWRAVLCGLWAMLPSRQRYLGSLESFCSTGSHSIMLHFTVHSHLTFLVAGVWCWVVVGLYIPMLGVLRGQVWFPRLKVCVICYHDFD